MKKRKLEVHVAIIAYNAEKNIEQLTRSLLDQQSNIFNVSKVIVYSDSSTDHTMSIIKKIRNKKIHILENIKRKGFAYNVVELFKHNTADYLILLNDDINIKHRTFVSHILKPFLAHNNVGLTSANIVPFKPLNFIEKAVNSGFQAFRKMNTRREKGDNLFTCDGKSLALSKEFISELKKLDRKKMGNVDTYLYFKCIQKKFKYKFANTAHVYFKFPSTIGDFLKWQGRNYSFKYLLIKEFGSMVEEHYRIPRLTFHYYRLVEILKNPIGSAFIYLLGVYCSLKTRFSKSDFNPLWDVVTSTKNFKKPAIQS